MDGDAANSLGEQHTYRPDQVIRPQPSAAPAPEAVQTPQGTQAAQPEPEIVPPASDSVAANTGQNAVQTLQPETLPTNTFTHDQTQPATGDTMPESISWTASEFIAHEKTAGWYVLLVLGAVAAAALVWLFTRDIMPTSAVFIGMVLLAFYAAHQPRQQHYELDASGLTIGDRHLPYHEFRFFSVMQEGAFLGIELTPLKRFAMYTTLYVDPADEDRIIEFLSTYLPMEEARASMTDSFMRRIHF